MNLNWFVSWQIHKVLNNLQKQTQSNQCKMSHHFYMEIMYNNNKSYTNNES